MKAMIVDDQASIRGMLKMLIGELGFDKIAEADNGASAVTTYKAEKPDLVLMDINMPKVTGVDALRQIIAHDPDAVVVMLTSQDTAQVVRQCLEAGASHYILKNVTPPKIQEQLKDLVAELYG
jgi:two-component system chemotaxis response regulator CheY